MNSPKSKNKSIEIQKYVCQTPQNTFDLGEKIGLNLLGGEMILLKGGLGAGKTLLTKGILYGLEYDVDEVNSPSFTLVNLYKTENFDVYHIDLWRLDKDVDAGFAIGLTEILEDENSIVIIEWSEKLKKEKYGRKTFVIQIGGDGEDARQISIETKEI